MSLREYRRKRDFKRTSEPQPQTPADTSGRRFVIQKHAARRLHYDFRLELDGVLKSWAVPKGPSLDPQVRALAVQVEDHPLAYADFEGIIPKGEYGGGTVMVWDQGEWEPEQNAAAGLRKGHLRFVLHGEKLAGGWSLVRMKGRDDADDGKNWLLIKRDDEAARPGEEDAVTVQNIRSVLSGRTLEEIAEDADSVWNSNGRSNQSTRKAKVAAAAKKTSPPKAKPKGKKSSGDTSRREGRPDPSKLTNARKARLPATLSPQLATAVDRIPEGDNWLHELKFDGYRLLAFIDGTNVRLLTRRGHDWTKRFAAVARAVAELPLDQSVLDGEVVALDANGVSDFQTLQNWLKEGGRHPLVYYVFDAPYLAGYDLQRTPLIERKELLASVLLAGNPDNEGVVRYSDHIRGQGPQVLEHSCRHALEGVVSKLADSPYETRRTRTWVKSKCHGRQEFVIGGFTRPQGARSEFGALLVGYREGKEWVYCGRVGTGFTEQSLKDLGQRLRSLRLPTSPFRNPPTGAQARGVTWTQPRLVAEVQFTEWTSDGLLRHPSFQGLREDKAAEDVVREDKMTRAARTSTMTTPGGNSPPRKSKKQQSDTIAGIVLSNPERVLYPEQGITKRQLAEFYVEIADWVLPSIVERPLTLVRCPQGRAKSCFYQKHWTESLPDAVDKVLISEKEGKEEYVVIHDLQGLISLVQLSVLELHPWGARTDRLERPDLLVFDLDPGEDLGWDQVKQAALEVRQALADVDLVSFVRTTGGKGLHVVVPITRRNTWDEVGEFAQSLAEGLARRSPEKYTTNMRKNRRGGRIFLDYLRNRRGATAIASYSTRARPGAPVATPIAWEELDELRSADQWTIANVPERLQAGGPSPWEQMEVLRQSITQRARDAAANLA